MQLQNYLDMILLGGSGKDSRQETRPVAPEGADTFMGRMLGSLFHLL